MNTSNGPIAQLPAKQDERQPYQQHEKDPDQNPASQLVAHGTAHGPTNFSPEAPIIHGESLPNPPRFARPMLAPDRARIELAVRLIRAGRRAGCRQVKTGLAQTEASRYTWDMATVTATLRNALERCGRSRYAVSKATGIPESTLSRFVAGGKPLRGENIDILADYLGLALTVKPGKTRKER